MTKRAANSHVKVLYFTAVPLGGGGNGGDICCSNHIRRISQEPGLDVFALIAGDGSRESETSGFLASLGVAHQFVTFGSWSIKNEVSTWAKILQRFVDKIFNRYFMVPWEIVASQNPHVLEALNQTLHACKIDVLVIDYSLCAFFAGIPRNDVKTCVIKLNREAEFYVEHLRQNGSFARLLTHAIHIFRMIILERKWDRSVDKIIVIGHPDLPKHATRSTPVCITPYLDRESVRWRYTNSRSVFFVGNIAHYPNHAAVAWIATCLAPELAKLRPDIRLKILGCDTQTAPGAWRKSTVDFMGFGAREDTVRLFQETDLLLCPIKNDFGIKFKTAEALAFGTPFLASVQTLLGFPYLTGQPAIHLDRPRDAALLISELVGDEKRLSELSMRQEVQHAAFVQSQASIWTRTITEVAGIPS